MLSQSINQSPIDDQPFYFQFFCYHRKNMMLLVFLVYLGPFCVGSHRAICPVVATLSQRTWIVYSFFSYTIIPNSFLEWLDPFSTLPTKPGHASQPVQLLLSLSICCMRLFSSLHFSYPQNKFPCLWMACDFFLLKTFHILGPLIHEASWVFQRNLPWGRIGKQRLEKEGGDAMTEEKMDNSQNRKSGIIPPVSCRAFVFLPYSFPPV